MALNIIFTKQSAVPYYHQIKEALKTSIANGELKPGDMLTSELGLSEQLGISRLVVHRAYTRAGHRRVADPQTSQGNFRGTSDQAQLYGNWTTIQHDRESNRRCP